MAEALGNALIITPDGGITVDQNMPHQPGDLAWHRVRLNCDAAAPVRLCDHVTMWLDEDGEAKSLPPNLLASTLATFFTGRQAVLFLGTALLTGDFHGDTVALSRKQVE